MLEHLDIRIYRPKTRGGFRKMELLSDVTIGENTYPKGTTWNGASSWIARQRALFASLVHDIDCDYIIQLLKKKPKAEIAHLRYAADRRFKENMRKLDNQHQIWCWIFYLGVRIGGGWAIKKGVKNDT